MEKKQSKPRIVKLQKDVPEQQVQQKIANVTSFVEQTESIDKINEHTINPNMEVEKSSKSKGKMKKFPSKMTEKDDVGKMLDVVELMDSSKAKKELETIKTSKEVIVWDLKKFLVENMLQIESFVNVRYLFSGSPIYLNLFYFLIFIC